MFIAWKYHPRPTSTNSREDLECPRKFLKYQEYFHHGIGEYRIAVSSPYPQFTTWYVMRYYFDFPPEIETLFRLEHPSACKEFK